MKCHSIKVADLNVFSALMRLLREVTTSTPVFGGPAMDATTLTLRALWVRATDTAAALSLAISALRVGNRLHVVEHMTR